jgi:hypothetical protein
MHTQCQKVKEVGDLMKGKLMNKFLVNDTYNYNNPKVMCVFLL